MACVLVFFNFVHILHSLLKLLDLLNNSLGLFFTGKAFNILGHMLLPMKSEDNIALSSKAVLLVLVKKKKAVNIKIT